MTWVPRFYRTEHTICVDDGEFEGWEVGVVWRGLLLFIVIAHRERQL